MNAAWSRGIVRRGLALVVLACAVTWAPACGDDKKPKKVKVSVVVILASEKGGKIDKKLECIAKEVQKMHPKLTNFELGNMGCQSLDLRKLGQFDLVENQTADVTILETADKMGRVCLKVAPPEMGEITYSTPCGKFLPILTPYRTKKDQLLIIAIRVQPCNGGK